MAGIEFIEGGCTAAKGFLANGVHCGIRRNTTKLDLAMIYSEKECNTAAVFTQNLVKGAPILVTQSNIKDGKSKAVIVNSGNANTCNADGAEKAEKMCELTAKALGIKNTDVIVASTGVIGQVLPIEPIETKTPELAAGLSPDGSEKAARAIMTTDTVSKESAVSCVIGGKEVKIGGIAKGTGMIHPNMATMLSFVTTDCAISVEMLKKAVKYVTDKTFNMISVDGDTSTNDTFAVMANGLAENKKIILQNEDFQIFTEALMQVCKNLSMKMAGDGEGATKLLICGVHGAETEEIAKKVAKSVICSSLVKAAMFGADANWGRVLCAIGYSGVQVDVSKIDVSFSSKSDSIDVCVNGAGIEFSEEKALKILKEKEILISVNLKSGDEMAEAYGCDLTYDYVRINGEYRT